MKGIFIIFDTDYNATIKKANIKNGKVVIGDKEWVVDKAKPFLVRTMFGKTYPLYLLKWNSVFPANPKVEEEVRTFVDPETNEKLEVVYKNLTFAEPKFDEKQKVTPEILRSTAETRFIKAMKRYTAPRIIEWQKWLPLILFILFLLIGGFLLQYGFQTGMIKM